MTYIYGVTVGVLEKDIFAINIFAIKYKSA